MYVVRAMASNILQGSVVTQTALDGLTTHPPFANFLRAHARNYESWLTVDKVIATINWLTFSGTSYTLIVHAYNFDV